MRFSLVTSLYLLAACAGADAPAEPGAPRGLMGAPALALGALDAAPRTIPYGGYVDFDGEPVNAGNVKFNFALFPCATPGTGPGGCAPLWVAKGTWTATADWKSGWPTGVDDALALPIFSGRFAVELGAPGQNPLPDAIHLAANDVLFLGIRIEGRALASLQKLTPALKAVASGQAERLRVRSAVEIDDPVHGGAATLEADGGVVVGHSQAALDPQASLFRIESPDGSTPFEARADGTLVGDGAGLTGSVRVFAGYTALYKEEPAVFTNGDGAQNWDDTVPEATEGMAVAAVTLTPRSATSTLVVDAVFHGVERTNLTDHLAICLFRDQQTEAFACATVDQNFDGGVYSGLANTVHLHYAFPAGTTGTTTIALRAGLVAAPLGSVLCMNGGGGARRLGGTLHSGLTVMEVL